MELIVKRLKFEVDDCIGPDYQSEMMDIEKQPSTTDAVIPYDRVQLLRGMMRLVLHLMQANGAADGVRNLIDSSLPKTILLIMESPLFVANVFCIGIYGSLICFYV